METLYSWQEKLRRRSVLVLLLSFLYLLLLFFLIFFYITGDTTSSLTAALLFSVPITSYQVWRAYTAPNHVVEEVTGAQPAEDPRLLKLVEKMKIAYGIKNVEVYEVPWSVINAFVVSKKDKHFLFVTRGAIEKLTEEELEGVLAHEFAHMEHGDSLVMTVAVVVAGITVLTAYLFLRVLPQSNRRDTLTTLAFFLALLLALLSPVVTKLLVSALSKEREFLADARAVEVTKYPPGLISALIKVAFENTSEYIEGLDVPKTFGALFFDFEDVDTHPPVYERVKRLAELTKTPVDDRILRKLRELGV